MVQLETQQSDSFHLPLRPYVCVTHEKSLEQLTVYCLLSTVYCLLSTGSLLVILWLDDLEIWKDHTTDSAAIQ